MNNFQCVQWVSEFCEKYNFSIVVTSTWALSTLRYKECLYNGGLRKSISILGHTFDSENFCRESSIEEYLELHNNIDKFLIFDDYDGFVRLKNHVVRCQTELGFNILKFAEAEELYKKLYEDSAKF